MYQAFEYETAIVYNSVRIKEKYAYEQENKFK